MADAKYYTKQQLPNQANPSKFYSHFLYKALLVLVFFVILPLFSSQAPEFLNQTLHTRGWELLHLIFVGIAVSYGLFSHRYDETEKEQNNHNYAKFDNAHSMVSRFLQVSSVFDDEGETTSGSDENKIQTWSSKYYRNESSVVVAQDHSVLGEQRGSSSRIGEKPLLLPVRSLKTPVFDPGFVESSKESSAISKSPSRSSSNSGSKRFSSSTSKPKIGVLEGLDHGNLEENVVLPSPIPWRSRSGRMEMKEEVDSTNPSMEEHELNRVESRSLKRQSSRLSRPNSSSSSPKMSPKKLSPSASLSLESQAKNAEDLVRKKSFHVSSPPPPPPPPPPPAIRRSSSLKPNTTSEPKLMSREDSGAGMKPRRSVRTIRDIEDKINGNAEDRSKEFDESLGDVNHSFRGYAEEEKEGFDDKVIMESDGESESDNDENEASSHVSGNTRSSNNEEEAGVSSSNVSDGGPDVDKKADEFIAKFREQIRLQRINSIRRSSAEISSKKP
ncbi:hypothetical protein HS088_TW20G00188 [Tripterygium wilfordii]|uniref:Hydroxyproline-rich glycoprotein family protein n=1 Tax=Tripterygium wilfordii TaxID=458696 RepID=A0A7J7C6M8_TRIWF|nr:uncharacterized protein DDB_G0284459 [Tripterygium wilfordii]KAF5729823.1 hypothetical protein HS088_TW20G00188 [Tripterygium wilfordii]